MARRSAPLLLILLPALVCGAIPARAAEFASPAFRIAWLQGEGVAPNFWGPTATEAITEQYTEAPGGMRLVQYFDKGRMELTDPASGAVTNGLLAKELIAGEIQIGAGASTPRDPPAIPIAGDPNGAGPTYALLHTTGAPLFAPTPMRATSLAAAFTSDNQLVAESPQPTGITEPPAYDAATQHNVLGPFATFRRDVGLGTIGYALCEPFLATFTVAGAPRTVVVQVFERRVLTYTDRNPAPFRTEFGNIGRHYYQWRYP